MCVCVRTQLVRVTEFAFAPLAAGIKLKQERKKIRKGTNRDGKRRTVAISKMWRGAVEKRATNLIWTLQTTKDINQLLKLDIFLYLFGLVWAANIIKMLLEFVSLRCVGYVRFSMNDGDIFMVARNGQSQIIHAGDSNHSDGPMSICDVVLLWIRGCRNSAHWQMDMDCAHNLNRTHTDTNLRKRVQCVWIWILYVYCVPHNIFFPG